MSDICIKVLPLCSLKRCSVPLLCDIKDLLVRIVINEGTNVVLKLITLHVFYRMAKPKGRYAVIEFLSEGSVEVVPTSWIYTTIHKVNIEIIEIGASI